MLLLAIVRVYVPFPNVQLVDSRQYIKRRPLAKQFHMQWTTIELRDNIAQYYLWPAKSSQYLRSLCSLYHVGPAGRGEKKVR